MLRGFLLAISMLSGTIENCSPSNSLAKIEKMGISPVNPQPGDLSTIWIEYTLPKDVTGGTATYAYTLNYIPFKPYSVDLCSENECPLVAGYHNSSGTSTFPDVSGRIDGKITWATTDGTPVWCVRTIYNV